MECDNSTAKKEEYIPTRFPFSPHDKEKLRLIGQELKYFGLNNTLSELSKETGIVMEHPVIVSLQHHILEAQWDDAYQVTQLLRDVVEEAIIEKIKYLILKSKFYELLQEQNFFGAFQCMRKDLANSNHVDILDVARLLVSVGIKPEDRTSIKILQTREKLIYLINDILPHDVIVPPYRLRKILQQSNEQQIKNCLYHNRDIKSDDFGSFSLFVDHACPKNLLPINKIKELNFSDEVLSVKFSPDGLYLAAGTKDGNVVIFKVDKDFKVERKHVIGSSSSDGSHISNLCWRPDGKYLLCSISARPTKHVILIDVEAGKDRRIQYNCEVQFVTWDTMNKEQFFLGGFSGTVILSNIHGNVIFTHVGYRAVGLHCLRSGSVIIADTQHRIVSYDLVSMKFKMLFQEDRGIVNIEFDSREDYIAVSLYDSSINLWDLKNKVRLCTFAGATISTKCIKSSIGGQNESFIASGSEDGYVFMWNMTRTKELFKLRGHRKNVNAVHWNPSNPMMMASCSDDETVLLWGPDCHLSA